MNQNYQLCSPWCVWLNYQAGEDSNVKLEYSESLKKVITIRTYNDLNYFWQQSIFKDVHNFLVFQGDTMSNRYTSFTNDNKTRFISAINYFREGINPTWEDPNNNNGGRLIFQINKEIQKYNEIYQWLIFYFLGESESCAQDINGIRFISHRSSAPFKFHYRVQVWTKFNKSEEDKVKQFRDTFVKDFFQSFLVTSNVLKQFKPSFKNNQQQHKDPQKQESKS